MSTTDIGRFGEKLAAKYLKKQKYKILEANKHESHNEIDLIVTNREYLVFVEVKTRSVSRDLYSSYGSPASAVTKGKQARTIQAARSYLKLHPTTKYIRMDVVEVYLDKETKKPLHIHHIPNAFGIK